MRTTSIFLASLFLAACASGPGSSGCFEPESAASLVESRGDGQSGRQRSAASPDLFAQRQDVQGGGGAAAEDESAALAKKLANPIAALISLPLQLNHDRNLGPVDGGERTQLNIQPVIPIELNDDWNIISRTIVPVVWQDEIFPGAGSQSGLGDTVQSLFFSPKEPTSGGWILGAGPVMLLPTGTDNLLSADKWGAGPTGVALRQEGPWTYGGLANHIWSFAGDDSRGDVNATFLQPFVSYTTPTAWTFALNTESTYDWESEQWSVPVNVIASKVLKIGNQLVSVGGGGPLLGGQPAHGCRGVRLPADVHAPVSEVSGRRLG